MILSRAACTAWSPTPGAELAVTVISRRRPRRWISAGPVPARVLMTALSGTVPRRDEGTVISARLSAVARKRASARTRMSYSSPCSAYDDALRPPTKSWQRLGDVGHLHAQVGGAIALDGDADLGLADDEGVVDVDGAGDLLERLGDVRGVLGELREIRALERHLHLGRGEAAAGDDLHLAGGGADLRREPGDDVGAGALHQLDLPEGARLRVDEEDEDAGHVARLAGALADGDQRVLHAGEPAHVLADALDDEAGLGEAGPLGGAEVDLELGLIVVGEEAARQRLGDGDARAERAGARQQHHPAAPHHPAEHDHVGPLDGAVEEVDPALQEGGAPALGREA